MSAAYSRRWIWGFLALSGLVVAISLYYIWHKPFSQTMAINLFKALAQTACAGGILAVCGGIGQRLTYRLEEKFHPWTAFSLQATLGMGVMSVAILVAGWFGGINTLTGALSLGALVAWLRKDILRWARRLRAGIPPGGWQGRLVKLLAALSAGVAAMTWFTATSPPIKFDALVYHLALPVTYANGGRIPVSANNFFWGMPQATEMLYTWAAALAGVEAAAILGWLSAVTALLGLAGWVRSSFGARPAWAAVSSLLCGFTLTASLGWGYVDWMAFACGLAVLVLLAGWQESGEQRLLLLGGALAGAGLGVKYSAGTLLLGGLAMILWLGRGRGWRDVGMNALIFGGAALFAFAPWLLKNAAATGNPFYPFFFPTASVSAWRLEFYTLPPEGGLLAALGLPVLASITGVEGAPGYAASIGPLLLALGMFAWLPRRRTISQRSALIAAVWIGGVGLFVWIAGGRYSAYLAQSRLHFALFPAFAAFAGAGFAGLDRLNPWSVRLGRVVGALVASVMAFSALELGVYTLRQGAMQRMTGISSREYYLEQNLGWYAPAMQATRQSLPPGSQTLMLWEPRWLYCQPGCTPDETLDRWKRDWRNTGSLEAVIAGWQEEGYTHLLVNHFGADYVRREDRQYTAAEWQALDDLLNRLAAPQDFGGAYRLYALEPGEP